MLSELVRVAKPGGRGAVIVRAIDIPLVVNVPLRPELKTKAQIPPGFVGARGVPMLACIYIFIRRG